MSENMQHTILRFAVVFLFIAIGFVVVILRIFSLQYVHREELEKKGQNLHNQLDQVLGF